jgi:chromosome segregation protein
LLAAGACAMLYLKSLSLERFKSFRHSELLFSKGFTCVVGPNGSGKSNICDALLFGLGELSMNRLRVNNLSEIVTEDGSKKKKLSVAKVKMDFTGDTELSVVKFVRSDGKSIYKVNGKKMPRKEVVDLLYSHGIRADETSTIAQFEINAILSLNPKERRELIEIAAGIKEFEGKKADALRELEKVTQRINEASLVLNERLGFLRELEKEKEAAEAYMLATSELRKVSHGVLLARKNAAKEGYDNATREMAVEDSRKNEFLSGLEEMGRRVEQLNFERQRLLKEMNEGSVSVSDVNKKLEVINSSLARTEVEIKSTLSEIDRGRMGVEKANVSISESEARIKENRAAITRMEGEREALKKQLPDDSDDTVADNVVGRIEKEEADVAELEDSIAIMKDDIARLDSGRQVLEGRIADRKSTLEALVNSAAEAEGAGKKARDTAEELGRKAGDLEKRIAAAEAEERDLLSARGTCEKKMIELREGIAYAGRRDSAVEERIRGAFGKEDGFYGKAIDLIEFDQKNAYAVEAAGGNRLEYYVVDGLKTAERIIGYLKKNGYGRATFIPIDSIQASRTLEVQGANALLDLIHFEKRFSKAFDYIFYNTYLVDSFQAARSIGIGKHRYVTLEGELIEQSGTVTGGTVRKRVSISLLTRQLAGAEKEREEILSRISGKDSELLSLRKELSHCEAERKVADAGLRVAEEALQKSKSLAEKARDEIMTLEGQLKRMAEELQEKKNAYMNAANGLAERRGRIRRMYGAGQDTEEQRRQRKEAGKRIAALRESIEALSIKIAEAQKENQLLERSMKEYAKQAEENAAMAKSMAAAVQELRLKEGVLRKSKKDLEEKILSSGAANKRIYRELEVIDAELQKISEERGRLGMEKDNAERRIGEYKMRKNQMEMRINDIDAELQSYKAGEAPADGSVEELESRMAVLNEKIKSLGTVNLKAPEIYNERAAGVEEARSKTEVLRMEKESVLKMIEEIDSKKVKTFFEAFEKVNSNFSRLYSYVYPDKAEIALSDPGDPLNSGIEIRISDGKARRAIQRMSGGEKSIISMMLILAVHLCKPAALYIFDEVDAALDKENSKTLSKLIKELSKEAQYIVVSHNDSLIVNADTAIGVVKVDGISKAIGVEIPAILNSQKS